MIMLNIPIQPVSILDTVRLLREREEQEQERIHNLRKKQIEDIVPDRKQRKKRKNNWRQRSSDEIVEGKADLDFSIEFGFETSLEVRNLDDGNGDVADIRFFNKGCATKRGVDIPVFDQKWDMFVESINRIDKYKKKVLKKKSKK